MTLADARAILTTPDPDDPADVAAAAHYARLGDDGVGEIVDFFKTALLPVFWAGLEDQQHQVAKAA